MNRLALALLPLVLLLPACGGSETAASPAAELAPHDAIALVDVNTNLDSGQWEAAFELLDKFPDGDRLLGRLRAELAKEDLDLDRDVQPALGDRVVIVFFGDGDDPRGVGLLQPEDQEKLDELLAGAEGDELVKGEVGEWTALAERQEDIAALRRALEAGTLEGSDAYQAASEKLPDDALATAFVNGERLTEALAREVGPLGLGRESGRLEWFAAALVARDDGVRLSGTIRTTPPEDAPDPTPVDEELLDAVPADALGVIAFGGNSGLRRQLNVPGLGEFERIAGIDLEQLADLLDEGGVLWASPSAPIPTFTLLLPGASAADFEPLARRVAALAGAEIDDAQLDGRPAKRISFGPVALTYGELDERLVLTTAARLEAPDESLTESEAFERARDAAEMPDEPQAFLFLNLERLVPLVETLLGFSGEDVPEEFSRNVRPLTSLLVFASGDAEQIDFAFFVEIR